FPKVDTRIVSLCAHDMTARESQGQIEAIHGIEASPRPISAIADAGMDAVTAWRNRPLESCYPTVLMDAIRVDIRRCRTRLCSAPRPSCQMGPETSWACGFGPMRARRSGPRVLTTCVTAASRTSPSRPWTPRRRKLPRSRSRTAIWSPNTRYRHRTGDWPGPGGSRSSTTRPRDASRSTPRP
ncbi:MAG: transposase, partial [Rhodobacteraceae bacterium]|nr:transposase [Paracoccaceae bacterium]